MNIYKEARDPQVFLHRQWQASCYGQAWQREADIKRLSETVASDEEVLNQEKRSMFESNTKGEE